MISLCRRLLGLLLVVLLTGLAFGTNKEPPPPNLIVDVSQDFAAAAAYAVTTSPTEVDDKEDDVKGSGFTEVTTTVEFRPDDHRAALEVVARGYTDTHTVLDKGILLVYTHNLTDFDGRKPIFLTCEGLTSAPAYVRAIDTCIKLDNVETRLHKGAADALLRKLGERGFYRRYEESRAKANRKATREIRERMDNETGRRLDEANRNLPERVYRPLAERNILPHPLLFRTTCEVLTATGRLADEAHPPVLLPPLPVEGCPSVALRLHESAANTAADRVLAGKTFTREDIEKALAQLPGQPRTPGQADGDKKPFAITFSKLKPVEVSFADNRVVVAVRTAQVTAGTQATSVEWRTVATYKIGMTARGLVLRRDGPLDSWMPGRPRDESPGGLIIAERTLIHRTLERYLKDELTLDETELTGNLKKVGKLKSVQGQTWPAGWLLLAWQRIGGVVIDSSRAGL